MSNYPPGMSELPDEHVVCSNCGHKHDHDEALKCPSCDNKVVCPACTYCHECQALVDDMPTCECGSGEVVDADSPDVCSKCFDEVEE